jgi:hypothetical protein
VCSKERIVRLNAETLKFKGKVHAMGMEIPFAGEYSCQGPDQLRTVIEFEVNGQKVPVTKILNRDRGWIRMGDVLKEMTPDEVKEAQEDTHEHWVRTLVPLADKAYKLSILGDSRVANRPALAIRVSCQGRRDVNLYFDKESFLLLKSEMLSKDEQTGKEVNREFLNSDFKEVGGLKEPMKFVMKKDGKLLLEADVEEIRRNENLDDSVFAKP